MRVDYNQVYCLVKDFRGAIDIAKRRGIEKMSAQAVGQAVSKNEFAIIIPCHRVIAHNGKLTGYRWGVDKKEKLLCLEGVDKEL